MDDTHNSRTAFYIKWIASVFQIIGYGATGFGLTPWNLMFFVVGLLGWFLVGVIWKDRALMLVHFVAFAAMVIGVFTQ